MKKFRSKLEQNFARYLLEVGLRVVYEPETFIIPPNETFDYQTRYTPDFFLPDQGVYIELKPTKIEYQGKIQKQIYKMIELSKTGRVFLLVLCSRSIKTQNTAVIRDGEVVQNFGTGFFETLVKIQNNKI